ncbi:hypothetical protein RKD49_007836 [Streptomyces glaucescens]
MGPWASGPATRPFSQAPGRRCPRPQPRIQPVGTRNGLFELLACLDG